MLWALAFIAMRQHQSDAIDAAPLHFARGNKLVNHHLRTVGKVAKLGFPNHQRVWVVRCIAVFKRQYGLFAQNRVDDYKRSLVVSDVLQRHVGAGVKLFAVLVVYHRVAVGKRAAPTVFTRQTHWVAAGHQ